MTVQTIGRGILIKGVPSNGFTIGGGSGIKDGGRYPTGQYLNPKLGGVENCSGFSTGGKPFGIGKRPTFVAYLENSFQ
jgi:hypothetical protein